MNLRKTTYLLTKVMLTGVILGMGISCSTDLNKIIGEIPDHAYSTPTDKNMRSGDVNLKPLDKENIKKLLAATDLSKTPLNIYASVPNIAACKPGALSAKTIQLALNRLNAVRRLSGVRPVEHSKEYTNDSQLAALLCAINEKTAHGFNEKPSGMSKSDFNKANVVLGKCNLGNLPLVQAVDTWQADPGNPRIGHRLWQIAPWFGKVGFGYIETAKNSRAPLPTGYTVERTCDMSAKDYEWNFVAWPAPGYFPLHDDLFPSSHTVTQGVKTSPWCLILREGVGSADTLQLIRERNGVKKTWQYYCQSSSQSDEYPTLNVIDDITTNGGVAKPVVVFYPPDEDLTYEPGDKYTVILKNLTETRIEFTTEFFALD